MEADIQSLRGCTIGNKKFQTRWVSVFSFLLILLFGGIKLTDTKAFKNIALAETQDISKGYISNKYSDDIVGKKGKSFTVLSKALRPLPLPKIDKEGNVYNAFNDPELRYRRRYVDLVVNDHVKQTFIKRYRRINFFHNSGWFTIKTASPNCAWLFIFSSYIFINH